MTPPGSDAVMVTLETLVSHDGTGAGSVVFEAGPAYQTLRAQERGARVTLSRDMTQMTVEVFDVS